MTWRPLAAPPPPGLQMMRFAQPAQRVASTPPAVAETDPYFPSVQLLLHANGADGSTSIVDSSAAARTITVNGATKLSTAQSKFGGSSILLDGTNSFLTVSGTDLSSIPGDLTVECWAYFLGTPSTPQDIIGTNKASSPTNGWVLRRLTDGTVAFSGSTTGSNGFTATGPSTPSVNAWHHLAAVLHGTTLSLFIDGLPGAAVAMGAAQFNTGVTATIGRNPTNASWYYHGYLDDVRLTKGVSRYVSFTPRTSEFPNS